MTELSGIENPVESCGGPKVDDKIEILVKATKSRADASRRQMSPVGLVTKDLLACYKQRGTCNSVHIL